MLPKKFRLHVGNLPQNVAEEEILKKFRKYGQVNAVDIKHRKEAGTDQILSTFCFVDFETDDFQLNKCLHQLDGLEWNNQHLKVSLAKESFLQRLQREREAAQNSSTNHSKIPSVSNYHSKDYEHSFESQRHSISSKAPSWKDGNAKPHNHSKQTNFKDPETYNKSPSFEVVPKEKNKEHLRTSKDSDKVAKSSLDVLKTLELFSEVWKDSSDEAEETQSFSDDLSSEDEENECNKESVEIESTGHYRSENLKSPTNQPKEGQSPVVSTTNMAEERRMKSLTEKQKTFEQQKKAVQLALSDGKIPRMNKKVIFDDEGEENDESTTFKGNSASISTGKRIQSQSKGQSLFEELHDEEDTQNWENDFKIKRQFEGEKGKKLLNLQSRFNNDTRFAMDERFLEDEEGRSDSGNTPENEKESNEHSDKIAEEREQQFQILSDIIGQPISTSKVNRDSSAKPMVRFDPSKPNHLKYEVSKEERNAQKLKKQKSFDIDNIKKKVQKNESEPAPVSKETFYQVSESLTDAFKSSKDTSSVGFSLLQMFGPSSSEPEKQGDQNDISQEPDIFQELKVKRSLNDMDEDQEEGGPFKKARDQKSSRKSKASINQSIVQQESFFFQPDDSRLKEGDDFFTKAEEEPTSFYAFKRKRRELRHLVNRKIQRNAIRSSAFKTKLGGRPRPRSTKPRLPHRRGRK